jgi:hypothetical protein
VAWTIPDKGEGDNDLQSILFQEYLDVLVAGMSGIDCVLNGGAITGGADMTPAVAKCGVLSNRSMFAVAAADVTIGAADATNPRIDLVVVNSSGALAVRAGTAAASPKPPARTANDVVLGAVYVPANDTSIETSKIVDMRVTPPRPTILLNQTTAKSQTASVAEVSIFNTAPTIPNGLLLAGRSLRVTARGNFLHNSTTTMTYTLIIKLGGTTIFNDATVALGTTAEADRIPWTLDFTISAHASDNIRMGGLFMSAVQTVVAPTTGTGDIGVDEILAAAPIGGAEGGITLDMDAANRTLDVTWTMSVNNANMGWTTQNVIVELI